MNYKVKEHRFVVAVKTTDTRKGAELQLLTAFSIRQPDSISVRVLKKAPRNLK